MTNRRWTRREFLMTASSALVAFGRSRAEAWHRKPVKGTGRVVVADPGGAWTPAWGKAYHETFKSDTGIESIQVARQYGPVASVKAQVQAGKYEWDITILDLQAHEALTAQGLLEPIAYDKYDFHADEMMKEALLPDWVGTDVATTVLGYRTDKYKGDKVPRSWADFWDVKRFPGRRAMWKMPMDTLEIALLADGVPLDKLYPLDVERAFKSLGRIKPHISVWWTSGAQGAQLIQSGEVDMIALWNGRIQPAIESGAPVAISWRQGILTMDGLGILKGAPNRENAQIFVSYATRPDRMAVWVMGLPYGPTNTKALQHVPPERAKILPTYPDNMAETRLTDYKFWAQNLPKLQERFQAWLLQG